MFFCKKKAGSEPSADDEYTLKSLMRLVQQLKTKVDTMSKTVLDSLADLKARVAAESDVNKSAIATMTNLSALLTAALANEAGDDDATVLANIKEIADGIDADKQALADAITANTPASTPTQTGGSDTPQA